MLGKMEGACTGPLWPSLVWPALAFSGLAGWRVVWLPHTTLVLLLLLVPCFWISAGTRGVGTGQVLLQAELQRRC